ncbi:MAG: 1-(5-phosphoribosyl)-5-amino-4-imidazole-carboxylate carboxylase [SAR202 cluster bacterium Io17-Chloro-G3]|nr:MAG: 1-(5-phosphoribosyl)-5-amino-4-imidazole-carboxylate carboxylase [SAR202 cluster bacterium Io17-Chloro-G3]
MDRKQLSLLLERVKSGETPIVEALESLSQLPFQDLGFAKVDHHRALRVGFPEVVFGEGKTPRQVAELAHVIAERSPLLITRIDTQTFEAVKKKVPEAIYNSTARIAYLTKSNELLKPGVIVACAGTADIPVAEEAAITAEVMGNQVERSYDIGVSGIHRLLAQLPKLREGKVIVVAAGMDAALPSVIGGLVSSPVIAVPTSVGYGASFQGLAALLAILNSCAPGVSVVNIDNGFGAGYLAAIINNISTTD